MGEFEDIAQSTFILRSSGKIQGEKKGSLHSPLTAPKLQPSTLNHHRHRNPLHLTLAKQKSGA
ncbi:MAG: hypothetical protein K0Q74_298 [Gammaproteobacteria bacterium]|jgi:hypothetical protein|nr:hypothetical protein [Gammaproteobacteria bacterium]